MTLWQQEYAADWWQTSEQNALRSLAREHHERTERFDQTHCRWKDKRGFGRPHDTERAACTAFAYQQHAQLGKHAARLGFDWRAWQDAIASEARHFEADWVSGRYDRDTVTLRHSEPSRWSDVT